MFEQRASGILLHPTSVPAHGGIGDLGPAAYRFIDFLAAARQTFWQVLPLGPPGYGHSPYSSTSAFAGSVLMISLDRLAERGWIDRARIEALPDSVDRVDYERVRTTKLPVLEEAARNFLKGAKGEDRQRFEKFCWENGWWLEDFVLFDALRRHHNRESWNHWPRELALRDPAALDRVRKELVEELSIGRFLQFAFLEQWRSVRAYASLRGIRILGDIAIFVSYDSADVWTHPEVFRLDREGNPEVVAGVPPDAFSETGQRWGNPLYRWDALRDRGYDWWVQRVRWALMLCDYIRLDHFRGFQAYWEIPASEPTAVNGRWVPGPGEDLFKVLQRQLGDLPFIAEDLGMITHDVLELRERMTIPGMRVMQFGFDNPGAHIYLPHKFEPNTVVYTGTHDNDTTPGWWKNGISGEGRRFAIAYLGQPEDGMHWAMIRAAEDSVARLCVIPLQDVLGLGSDARMNVPSSSSGNWSWRYQAGSLTPELADKLATLMVACDRGGPPEHIPEFKEYFVV
ncbi:MAG TPA: 4-alpha-glucanotransferase [Terriglobales bacterium]|nr:4-alpha-glucanotransferase [Terriglobales bacterium]